MPNRLNTILNSTSALSQLAAKAQQLTALQQQLELLLPASLKPSCHVIRLEQQTLTLAVDNGAIAAKLRQMTHEMISGLVGKGYEITLIQIQVQVHAPPYIPPSMPRILSQAGKNHLAQLSENLSDSPLKSALTRLAKKT